MSGIPWTKKEVRIVVENYALLGPKKLGKLLPKRSRMAIKRKADVLGCRKRNRYTSKEEAFVRTHYPTKGGRWVANKLCRPYRSVTSKVIALGLKATVKTCSDSLIYIGRGKLSGSYWVRTKWNAINRGLDFDITIEYGWSLFQSQDGKCKLTGVDLTFSTRSNGKDGTASLDRIDSSKGYVEGNVQWVHKRINAMKNNMTDEEFVSFCRLVVKHSKLS